MIRHIVLTKLKPEVREDTLLDVYAGLARVAKRLDGAESFVGGPSQSPEQLERGYTHAFTIDFQSWEALNSYAEDSDHQALGRQLVECADGGVEGLLVLDILKR